MTNRFSRYELRTTDPDRAREFYTAVLGLAVWESSLRVTFLPERARAAGAPPHWLGHIGVPDVEAAVVAIEARGGTRLGPTLHDASGSARAALRDPFGAVLAVSAEPASLKAGAVAWHLHTSLDERQAWNGYSTWFGWTPLDTVDLGPVEGRHQVFSWSESGVPTGSMADLARQPGIHPQWLFFFAVPDLDTAVTRVAALGGTVLATTRTGRGDLVVPCDDPHGGAFGLCERPVN